jgi:enoyl-CoA hydratase
MSDIVIDYPDDDVCRLRFNRPEALNSFTYPMYEAFLAALEEHRFRNDIRVIIVTGTGKGFCAGHDVKAGSVPGWVPSHLGKAQTARAVMAKLGSIPVVMRSMPQPIIAAVNGATAGLGYSIALAAEICLAARSAKFVNAFHTAATGHELGFSYMLPRAVGTQRAAELMLTGRAVMAEEAAAIGLALRTVDDDRLMDEALALAAQIKLNCPIGIELTKQSMWLNADAGSLAAAIELENRAIFMSQTTEDAAEKRKAMLEKRPPNFRQK